MKALVLDFDGVIAQSAPEAFRVALETYTLVRPGSQLAARPEPELYAAFLDLIPLGNRAEDYGVALAALEAGEPIAAQESYDAFYRMQDPAWLRAFHQRFYRVRAALAARDPRAWEALLPAYPELVSCLRRHAGEATFAIATAKDRASVRALLAHYGIADLFDESLVLDKETGVTKRAHLEHLQARLGLAPPELTFIDDKVTHLDAVAPLGVRCALAAWGYNGPREHALARRHGHLVCTLDDLEALIFAAAGAAHQGGPS